ncbi:VIT domain-containing protein [Paraliomyxa miuraensis]|uniref:VIT domain-containing protein n=1 Tax=Paraliomyxa miuraensis TaxID=376150 RepID=UPI00224FAA82|nr:VIT domain-containing protein [Paraliomyxa miuraensis]MCX4243549.1 VIT domain-containing protein [Paraliomyxa miuraensis]
MLWLLAVTAQAAGLTNSTGRGGTLGPSAVKLDDGGVPLALTEPGELPRLRLVDGSAELPLRKTKVSAHIMGFVAQVEVTQTYGNPHAEPIEAVYVFPLPENSAVDDMRIVIGDRVIEAEIQERARARRTYEQARRSGHTAALLEQERTNVFTQSIANLAPGEDIDVVVRYVQDLTYDGGQYEFVFPMVVGPRYVAGRPHGGPPSGTGTQADTDAVPDASRVSPPVAGPGTRTGHDIAVEVVADAGLPIRGFDVPTHRVTGGLRADGTLAVSLAKGTSIPNRDFVLRYGVAGQAVVPTLLTAGDDRGGHFTLIVQPPELDVDGLVGARELLFVVDVSGSMHGVPLEICKVAMKEAIGGLRPVDTFNIVTFAGSTGLAFDEPRPANDHNVREALAFVSGLRAGGGTEILDAIDVALADDPGGERHRYVFFLTDGFVSIEDDVYARTTKWIDALARRGRRARVFSLGVGASVNHELLANLAKAGRGLTHTVGTREDPRRAVQRFEQIIDHPIWTDLTIDWGDMAVVDLHPATPPDLFVSRPAILHGRYVGKPGTSVKLHARAGERSVHATAAARRARVSTHVVSTLWARARIEDLQHAAVLDRGDHVDEITQLGLDHRLVTPYTSFVAVDRSRVVGSGDPKRVVQPVDVPEGVDAQMAGAEMYREQRLMKMMESSAVYEFQDDEDELYDAPALTSRTSERELDDAVEYERAEPASAGCAHCGRKGSGDLVVLCVPLLVLGLRRRRRS